MLRNLWDIISGRSFRRAGALREVMAEVVERAYGLDSELLRDWVVTAAWAGAATGDYLLVHSVLARAKPRRAGVTAWGLRRLLGVLAACTLELFSRHAAHKRTIEGACETSLDEFAALTLGCFDPYALAAYRLLAELGSESSYGRCLANMAAVAVWQPENPRVYRSSAEQAEDGAPVASEPVGAFDLYLRVSNRYGCLFLPHLALTSWGPAVGHWRARHWPPRRRGGAR